MKTKVNAKKVATAKDADHILRRLMFAVWLLDDGGLSPQSDFESEDEIFETAVNSAIEFARLKLLEAGSFPPNK